MCHLNSALLQWKKGIRTISIKSSIMKTSIGSSMWFLLLMFIWSCANKNNYSIQVDEVHPWCILEFDAVNRTPTERIAMLKKMGFTRYGYDWEDRHLSEMKEEFRLAKKNDIEITSIFLWLNAKRDSLGKLSPSNQKMLRQLAEVEYKPTIWLSFSSNFFEGLNQDESVSLSIEMIKYIKSEADQLGCELALYNHRGWFGNPHNQVEIIKALEQHTLTMVFNFHHAHEYLDEYPEMVKTIRPYLSHVNLNGMKKEGPKILTLGEGDHEFEMIRRLIDEGFNGPWGILGHIKTEDVREVLNRNADGLKLFNTNN